MNQERQEQLSRLLDNDLDVAALDNMLDAVENDPALRTTWQRYQLIGEAMRRAPIRPAVFPIADRVQIYAKNHDIMIQKPHTHSTLKLPNINNLKLTRRHVYFGGLALAASVALMAISVGYKLSQHVVIPQEQVAKQVSPVTVTPAKVAMPRSFPLPMPAYFPNGTTSNWANYQAEAPSNLDLFFVNYHGHAVTTSPENITPYTTFIDHDP